MIALREAPMRFFDQRSDRRARFGLADVTLLGRDEDAIVYGLIGRFWKPDYGLMPIADGPAFPASDDRNAAKLVWSFAARTGVTGSSPRRESIVQAPPHV